MPLYSYSKAPVSHKPKQAKSKFALKVEREPVTVGRLLKGIKNDIKELLTTSKLAGTLIPAIFMIYGLNLLSAQIIPTMVQAIQQRSGLLDQGIIALTPEGAYNEKLKYLSAPGTEYFAEIQNQAIQTRVLVPDPVSNNFKGRFQLSIPSLGLNNLSVQANTNSGIEAIYDEVLESGLAHMESTGLPISDVDNNIVIYGHSSSGDYYKRSKDPAAAFTELSKIKIGDEITLTISGQTFKYKVSKTRIVEPTDLSIIAGEGHTNKQPLTLFTCSPNGVNRWRFVVTALPE